MRSNQSILKEISPGISLEGMMLKLKLQYFGHLMRRVDSLEKTLMLGGIGGRRRRGQQRMRWLDDITDSMDVSLCELGSWWWTGRPGVLQFMGWQRVGHDWATELNWEGTGSVSLWELPEPRLSRLLIGWCWVGKFRSGSEGGLCLEHPLWAKHLVLVPGDHRVGDQ